MNNELTNKVIRRARQERTLFAALIQDYADHYKISWQQIGDELRLTPEQLNQLALCRRPRRKFFVEDVRKLAQHIGTDEVRLAEFYSDAAQLVTTLPIMRSEIELKAASERKKRREREPMKFRYVLAAGLAVIALVIVGMMLFSQPEPVNATLIVEQGEIEVNQTKTVFLFITTNSETNLTAGDALVVRAGDHIAVKSGGEARLALADGSSIELIGAAELDVAELQTGENMPYRVAIDVSSGRLYNRVERLLGTDEAFEVNTPSSTAAVRGTAYAIEIISPVSSHYATDEGTVAVTMDGQTVEVHAGQMITATLGEPLVVLSQVDVTPPAITINSPVGQPSVGSEVVVSGITEPGATVIIDGITAAVDANGNFEGTVEASAAGISIEAADEAGNVTTVLIDTQ